MRKKLLVLLTLPFLFSLGACGDNNSEHTHTYESEWSSDQSGHWHASTCGHNSKADFAPHSGGTATDEHGKFCEVCNFEYTAPITCEHETINEYGFCSNCSKYFGVDIGLNQRYEIESLFDADSQYCFIRLSISQVFNYGLERLFYAGASDWSYNNTCYLEETTAYYFKNSVLTEIEPEFDASFTLPKDNDSEHVYIRMTKHDIETAIDKRCDYLGIFCVFGNYEVQLEWIIGSPIYAKLSGAYLDMNCVYVPKAPATGRLLLSNYLNSTGKIITYENGECVVTNKTFNKYISVTEGVDYLFVFDYEFHYSSYSGIELEPIN